MAVCPPRTIGQVGVMHMAEGLEEGGEKDERVRVCAGINRGYCGNLQLWHRVGRAGKVVWVFSVPETAFSIDVDMGLSPPSPN